MSKAQINDLISVEIPEGFHTMSEEELRQAYSDENPNRWGMWNKQRHAIVTVMWKEYPWLMKLLMPGLKAICRNNEQLISKGYANNNYACGGFFSAEVDGEKAEGYRFNYRVGDEERSAETLLFRDDRTIYSLTCYGRSENREADRELFDGIIAGIKFL